MSNSRQSLVKDLSIKYPKISEILAKTGVAEFDNKRSISFSDVAKTKNDVSHCFGIVKTAPTQNESENTVLQSMLSSCAPWEYHAETNTFEFGDDFYAIYGTNVEREGRFMEPHIYFKEFVHPEDACFLENIFKNWEFSERYSSLHIEHRIIRRDGEVRTIIVRSTIVRDTCGKIIKHFGMNQDITEQKAIQEALLISKEELSQAAQLAQLGPWEINLKNKIGEFNDEFFAIYGTSVEREGRFMSCETYIREFVHPEDVPLIVAEFKRSISSSGIRYTNQFKHRIIRRDGAVRTIIVKINIVRDETGKIRHWYGANQDITEQIKVEQNLRESEERLNTTLNTLPDMLFRIDKEGIIWDYRIPSQYVRYVNRTISVHDNINGVLPEQLTELINDMIVSLGDTGEVKIHEYIGKVNGVDCSLQIRATAINAKETLVIIQDQTELNRAKKEIQRLDKLDLIGKMAAGIGHEIRNPLTTVRGYLQFISSKEHFKEYAEKFDLMISELDRSNMIISEFLALSKNKVSRLELKDLNAIVLAIYPLLEVDALSENKIINLELDRSIPQINLDESEIRQLVINLVRNGLEAMTDKGVLTIRTRHDNQHVMLVVQDCGSGIPQNIIDQVGTPFFTTKDYGTGLGLSVCYSIAARHKAFIDVKTDKNGTEFAVSFDI